MDVKAISEHIGMMLKLKLEHTSLEETRKKKAVVL